MLQFPAWKVLMILVVMAWGVIFALPNVVNMSGTPGVFPKKGVNLGLDLQGGVYLLMEIDPDEVVAGRLEVFARDVRSALGANGGNRRIGQESELTGRVLTITLTKPDETGNFPLAEAIDRLAPINPLLEAGLGGGRIFEVTAAGDRQIRVTVPQSSEDALMQDALGKTITIVGRRVDPDGVSEVSMTPQGNNRIILEAPGEPNPQRLKDLLSQDGRMTFNLVESSQAEIDRVKAGVPKAGYSLLSGPGVGELLVRDIPEVVGSDIATASQGNDEGNRPKIDFRLNSNGALKFYETTRNNPGKLFAIVLDDVIMSAPRINEPIPGGSVEITGSFTLQEAQDLAAIIEAGEMPAKVRFLDQRTVSATLGEDSIESGIRAGIVGLLLVAAFMILAYSLQGVFAVLSLVLNMILIFASLAMINATLTLPGIAGIVLTIGMAVDANVLVFERIREEQRAGRSAWTAVQAGYERALITILDSNITALFASAILYFIGSGPVKGFAVTLSLGILTSMFTAFVFTRMLTVFWMKATKPKRLAI